MIQNSLRKYQKKQSEAYKDLCYGGNERRQTFAYYIGRHPNLYNGVDLDMATIDFINNHFYEYEVNPVHFDIHFLNALRKAVPIYNNLKLIEFNAKIFDITTNKSEKKLIANAINELEREGSFNSTTGNTGTITDNGTGTEHTTSANTDQSNTIDNGDTKQASRELPMLTTGSDFSDTVEWSNGASGINETQTEGSSRTNSNGTATGDSSTTANNVRTLNTAIHKQDANALKELATKKNTDKATIEAVNGQAVNLIRNIWQYLIEPKSIDYLIKELESCFILVI